MSKVAQEKTLSKRKSDLKKLWAIWVGNFFRAPEFGDDEARIAVGALAPFCGQRTTFQVSAKIAANPRQYPTARTVKLCSYEEVYLGFQDALMLVHTFDEPAAEDLTSASMHVMLQVTTPAQRVQALRDAGLDSIADAVERGHAGNVDS